MCICEDCNAVFEKPHYGIEEEPDTCPNCGSWSISEAKQCRECNEFSSELYYGLCENCKEQFSDAVKGFIALYTTELGLSENDVINMIQDVLEEI